MQETLEVLSLELGKWALLCRYQGFANVRAVPFDAIEIELGALWV